MAGRTRAENTSRSGQTYFLCQPYLVQLNQRVWHLTGWCGFLGRFERSLRPLVQTKQPDSGPPQRFNSELARHCCESHSTNRRKSSIYISCADDWRRSSKIVGWQNKWQTGEKMRGQTWNLDQHVAFCQSLVSSEAVVSCNTFTLLQVAS